MLRVTFEHLWIVDALGGYRLGVSSIPQSPPSQEPSIDSRPVEGVTCVMSMADLGEGWVLLLRFQSFDGVVHLVDVAVSCTGERKGDDLAAWLVARNSIPPSAQPATPFRYRWMRDIQQQYERDARRLLATSFRNSKETLAEFLAGPGWDKRRPRTRGYGDDDYAVVASMVIEIQDRGGNIVKELCREQKVSYWTAKEWITRATKLGLLTSPGKGKRNYRQLTPKAISLLDDLHAKERHAHDKSGDRD